MSELRTQIYKTPPLTNSCVIAHLWISRGWRLLPCQPGTKRLVMGFGPNQGKIENGEDVRFWFQERGANLAVLASDSGVILDFDKIELYNQFVAGWPGLAGSYTEFHASRRSSCVFRAGSRGGADPPWPDPGHRSQTVLLGASLEGWRAGIRNNRVEADFDRFHGNGKSGPRGVFYTWG